MNLPRKLSRVVSAVACCVLATCLSVGLVACANNDEQLIRASVTKTLDLFKDPTKEKLGDFVESSSVDVDQLRDTASTCTSSSSMVSPASTTRWAR